MTLTVIKHLGFSFEKSKVLQVGATVVGVFTLALGIFTDFYYFNFIYNVPNPHSNFGACYLIGGFVLIVAGSRLIWRSAPAFFHFKQNLSAKANSPNYGTTVDNDAVYNKKCGKQH